MRCIFSLKGLHLTITLVLHDLKYLPLLAVVVMLILLEKVDNQVGLAVLQD